MTVHDRTAAAVGPGGAGALRRFALPLICIAQLMATLDVTIVNLALPAVQRQFAMSNAGLAWVIDAYTLAYAGLLLAGGRAGDLLGHRRTLMAGIALFTASSLVAGLAGSTEVLLAARAGQGLGAALATPTTLSLITVLTPPGPRRTAAMVAYGAMAGLGITLGLVLGGVLTEAASWRWIFLVNVPVGVVLLLSAPRVLPDSRGLPRRVDVLGAVLATAALTTLVFGVIRAGTHHWGEPTSVIALLVAPALGAAFVAVELRVAEPMLPIALLRSRVRFGAYLVAALLFACLYPSFFLLSRALQDVQGLSAVDTGLQFLPLGVGVLAFAILTRRLMDRIGGRVLVLIGTTATAAGSVVSLTLERDSAYAAVMLPALLGLGAGVGTTFVANAALAMTEVPEQDAGIGSGLLSTFQAVGGTIGVAVLASVAASRTESQLRGTAPDEDTVLDALLFGTTGGLLLAAVLAVLAVVVALATAPKKTYPEGER